MSDVRQRMGTLAAIVFLIGYALSIASAMFAIERRVRWPCLMPLIFAGIATTALSSSDGLYFDPVYSILLASTAILGWASARFQLRREKQ